MTSRSSRLLVSESSHTSCEESESAVSEELELLVQVYLEELEITHRDNGDVELIFHIMPSTGDDKGKQYVCLDLHAVLGSGYPTVAPEICVCQPRGLSDSHVRGIAEGLHYKCTEHLGSPMMYELVEYAKDCLTDNNLPCGKCAICQFNFMDTDHFTKTSCYHYFHVSCLARYLNYYQHQLEEHKLDEARMDSMMRKKPKQLECPVCREVVGDDEVCLQDIQPLLSEVDHQETQCESKVVQLSDEIKAWQVKMARLLWKQKERGGVIDVGADHDVMDESWVSTGQANDDIQQDKQTVDQDKQAVGQDKQAVVQDTKTVGQQWDKKTMDQQHIGQLNERKTQDDDVSVKRKDKEKRRWFNDHKRHRGNKSDREVTHFTRDKETDPGGAHTYRHHHSSNHHGYKKRLKYHSAGPPTSSDRDSGVHHSSDKDPGVRHSSDKDPGVRDSGVHHFRRRGNKQERTDQPRVDSGCHGNTKDSTVTD